jgi:DNA-binding response OmpR family regulator
MLDEQRPAQATAAAGSRRLPAVLVIDDDQGVVLSIAAVFEAYGIRVASARDGAEGLRLFREASPTVVITDIIMPEKDGIGAIMEMRRQRPGVKIIAMSGGGRVGNSDFLTIAKRLGADETVTKPFDPTALVEMVRRLL